MTKDKDFWKEVSTCIGDRLVNRKRKRRWREEEMENGESTGALLEVPEERFLLFCQEISLITK